MADRFDAARRFARRLGWLAILIVAIDLAPGVTPGENLEPRIFARGGQRLGPPPDPGLITMRNKPPKSPTEPPRKIAIAKKSARISKEKLAKRVAEIWALREQVRKAELQALH